MASTTETVRREGGGPELLVRHWPATGPAWAAMLIVHGIAEHSGRYEHVGDGFAAAGIDVWALDLRGNGGSGGRRAYVDRWSDYLDDVEWRLGAVRQTAAQGNPVVLLSSPALDSTIPGWKKALARALSGIAPTMRIRNELTGDQLSSDPTVGERYFADPMVERTTTTRLAAEALGSQDRVARRFDALSTPTLIFHGHADSIVPVAASEPLGSLPGVRRVVLPDLRHETLNEPSGPGIVADVVRWLREQTARREAPSGAAPGPSV
jgi:alpha-beta hydrolase superfamily lysophospholipase